MFKSTSEIHQIPVEKVNKTLEQLAFILWFMNNDFIVVINSRCLGKISTRIHKMTHRNSKQLTFHLLTFDASIKNNLLYTIYQTDVLKIISVSHSKQHIFFSSMLPFFVPVFLNLKSLLENIKSNYSTLKRGRKRENEKQHRIDVGIHFDAIENHRL